MIKRIILLFLFTQFSETFGANLIDSLQATIKSKIENYEPIDFEEIFPSDISKRILSSDIFLKIIRDNSLQINIKGLKLINARITGNIALHDLQSKNNILFKQCTFDHIEFHDCTIEKKLLFEKCIFKKNLSLYGTEILSDLSFNSSQFINNSVLIIYHCNIGNSLLMNNVLVESSSLFKIGYSIISNKFEIQNTYFDGAFEFQSSEVKNRFSCNGSKFTNKKGTLLYDLYCRDFKIINSQFSEPFLARNISVQLDAQMMNCFFNSKSTNAFEFSNIQGNFLLDSSEFNGPISFAGINVSKTMSLRDVKFNSSQEIIFQHIKVGESLLLNDAIFLGGIDFYYASIQYGVECFNASFKSYSKINFSNFFANDLKFVNTYVNSHLIFANATIKKDIIFDSSVFGSKSILLIESSEIGGNIEILNDSLKGEVKVSNTEINRNLSIHRSNFSGEVIFSNLNIGRNLGIIDSKITTDKILLTSLQINWNLLLYNSNFNCQLTLDYSDVKGNIRMDGAEFSDSTIFNDDRCYGNFYFKDNTFNNSIELTNFYFYKDFKLSNSIFTNPEASAKIAYSFCSQSMELSHNKFGNSVKLSDIKSDNLIISKNDFPESSILQIEKSKINDSFQLDSLSLDISEIRYVEVGNKFQNSFYVTNNNSISFLKAHQIIFQAISPQTLGHSRLNNIDYDLISYNDINNKQNVDSLISIMADTIYYYNNLAELFHYYKEHGEETNAVTVLEELKKIERINASFWKNIGSHVLQYTVNYGQNPFQIFYFILGLWIITFISFRRKFMSPVNKNFCYYPFWYSLDLIVPVIDLKVERNWDIKKDIKYYRLLFTFRIIFKLFGWLFFTIFALALTGFFK